MPLDGVAFHDWSDYNGDAFSTKLLEWGRTFSDFWVAKINPSTSPPPHPRSKNMTIEGETVSYSYILVISKLILFHFSDKVCGLLFLLNNCCPLKCLEYAP